MDEQITYQDDFYGWSRQQAAALRDLAERRDLPNVLDLEHVAEEIEDVGNAQRSAVQSFIRLAFVHLLKAASVEAAHLRSKWRGEILTFHAELVGRYSASMRQDIDVQELWEQAYEIAKANLASHGDEIAVPADLPCPLHLDELLHRRFDVEAAVDRIEALRPRP